MRISIHIGYLLFFFSIFGCVTISAQNLNLNDPFSYNVPDSLFPNKRTALLIGNTNYINKDSLKNPANDVNLIYSVLIDLNFEVVVKEDLNFQQMEDEFIQFVKRLSDYDFGFFYYAGHGLEGPNRESYLIPIDWFDNLPLSTHTLAINQSMEEIEFHGTPTLICIDACRELMSTADISREINPNEADNIKTFFSTKSGKRALDSPKKKNSYYALHLSENLKIKGDDISTILSKTKKNVQLDSKHQQNPVWYHGYHLDDLVLKK